MYYVLRYNVGIWPQTKEEDIFEDHLYFFLSKFGFKIPIIFVTDKQEIFNKIKTTQLFAHSPEKMEKNNLNIKESMLDVFVKLPFVSLNHRGTS